MREEQALVALYDAECGVCAHFKEWYLSQSFTSKVLFENYRSSSFLEEIPALLKESADREILVRDHDGEWRQGGEAWLVLIKELPKYSKWVPLLARPQMLPLVKQVCVLVSQNRLTLSKLLRLKSDQEKIDELKQYSIDCDDDCSF